MSEDHATTGGTTPGGAPAAGASGTGPSADPSAAQEKASLWGGRFGSGPAAALAALSVSTHFDWRLAQYDLRGSKAHANVLHAAGLLDDAELAGMQDALDLLAADVASGEFAAAPEDEDVHTALERGLIERAGPELGGKLRAGRSRNDQIATLIRLFIRDQSRAIGEQVLDLVDVLVARAREVHGAAMPATWTPVRTPRRTAPGRWPARASAWIRRRSPRSSASPTRCGTRSTGPLRAISPPSSPSCSP